MIVGASFFLKTFFNLHLFAFSFEPDCTCRTECVFKLCWKPAANKGDKGLLFLTLHNNREGINNAALKKNPLYLDSFMQQQQEPAQELSVFSIYYVYYVQITQTWWSLWNCKIHELIN